MGLYFLGQGEWHWFHPPCCWSAMILIFASRDSPSDLLTCRSFSLLVAFVMLISFYVSLFSGLSHLLSAISWVQLTISWSKYLSMTLQTRVSLNKVPYIFCSVAHLSVLQNALQQARILPSLIASAKFIYCCF